MKFGEKKILTHLQAGESESANDANANNGTNDSIVNSMLDLGVQPTQQLLTINIISIPKLSRRLPQNLGQKSSTILSLTALATTQEQPQMVRLPFGHMLRIREPPNLKDRRVF